MKLTRKTTTFSGTEIGTGYYDYYIDDREQRQGVFYIYNRGGFLTGFYTFKDNIRNGPSLEMNWILQNSGLHFYKDGNMFGQRRRKINKYDLKHIEKIFNINLSTPVVCTFGQQAYRNNVTLKKL
jgi:hypothetical protein